MAVAWALGPLGAVAVVTLVLTLLLRWLWDVAVTVTRFWATCHQLRRFPRPPWRNWLLGHTGMAQVTEEGMRQVAALVSRYRDVCLWWVSPWIPVLRLFHPDTLRPILTASAFVAPKDQLFYGFLRPWLGDGLLLSGGRKWWRHRRLLSPAFHGDVVRGHMDAFNRCTHHLHAQWRAAAQAAAQAGMQAGMQAAAQAGMQAAAQAGMQAGMQAGAQAAAQEVLGQLSLLTLDTLQSCIFGHQSHCPQQHSEYIKAIMELSTLVVRRQQRLLHHPTWLYRLSGDGRRFARACATVHAFTAAVVQRRRQELRRLGHQAWPEGHLGRRMDFIDLLLLAKDEDGNALSDEDIAAEADTFMFEGHDTTASGLAWLLYNLARHPDYQQRCRQEVLELLRGRDTEDIEWEDLSHLPFTTMCIKESLRLHPPVTAVSRRCTQDIALRDGRVVPKGVICLMSIYGTHHNPDVWPEPEVFNPLRFSPENSKGRAPLAFVPFSAGPRNCIGQSFAMAEMKVVAALTVARFLIRPEPARPPRRKPELILRAQDGLWLRLEPLPAGA
ncbi:cytochrome P450 4F3 [Caloenas nicobarica]|uniref:cytochrome P450 4F3 n=1 Tax=Caloenas nicobarica TaxID=187106 RepID=UPI0032B8212D